MNKSPSRLLSLTIATALFIENMDSTVLATATPTIADHLGESPLSLKLALTSYMVSLAIFIPVSGWIADRFSARRVFCAAIVVFLIGSLACAFAASLEGLVLARALQGAGGAMMVPVGRLIMVRATPKSELVHAMMWLTMPALVGPVIGPLVGGFIVTHADWRWIFLLNVPIGLLGIVLGLTLIPPEDHRKRIAFDIAGFVLSATTLVSLMVGSIAAERFGIANPAVLALLAIGLVCGWATWRHARRTEMPLLDTRLFKLPIYRAAVLGGTIFRIGVGAMPFLLPLTLQVGFGLSPLDSGFLTFVSAAGALVIKPVNVRLLRRFGFRPVLVINGFAASLFIVGGAAFSPSTPHAVIQTVLFCGGCLRSLQFTSLNALAFAEIEHDRVAAATSLSAVAQQVALSLGVTCAAAALDLSMYLGGRSSAGLVDFSVAFLIVGAVSMTAAPIFLLLPPNAGAEISGKA